MDKISKSYITKLAFSLLVLFSAALLAGCRCAPELGLEPGVEYYARYYIDKQAATLAVGIFDAEGGHIRNRAANVIDTRIDALELAAAFDDITTGVVELWRLDFALLTDDIETDYLRWGTFSPDSNGWIGHHTGWNDARVLLVFSMADDGIESGIEFHGSIPWYAEEMYGMEESARLFLLGGGSR